MTRRQTREAPPEPLLLDIGTLSLFVGQACADHVQQVLAARGYQDARFSHGFVIQHLVDSSRTIGDLAERLGVTQQAASKSVAELERLGYLARATDVDDGRRRVVRLTRRGRSLVGAARKARRQQEARMVRNHGADTITACRLVLAAILEDLGGSDAVRQRRVRAPR